MTCLDVFRQHQDIGRLVFAGCLGRKEEAIKDILRTCDMYNLKCDLNTCFCMQIGPSLFGEETHYSEGNVTPLFALVLSTLKAASNDPEDTNIIGCFQMLLEHSANPYNICKLSEYRFPIQVLQLDLDVRGLLKLCHMFGVGSAITMERLETTLDIFEMKMGLQELSTATQPDEFRFLEESQHKMCA